MKNEFKYSMLITLIFSILLCGYMILTNYYNVDKDLNILVGYFIGGFLMFFISKIENKKRI